ncbi:MAG: YebC/PmpR family DNA-binding transcriptional regulator [Phycisphaerae bacterium]
MAGHSHWARIKRAKAVTDARRGKQWSKLSRAIIVAARIGGGDPAMNLQLRYAIDAAKAANMPKDTIERAIKKGAGALEGANFEEIAYEGYGPGGAAIIAVALTDNRNRTAPEVKRIFEMRGGNLGVPNCVSWMFAKQGVLFFAKSAASEETITTIALEAGADDVLAIGDEGFQVTCAPESFSSLRAAFDQAGIKAESAELTLSASSQVELSGADAEKIVALIDALEDHDDIQNVYSNFELADGDAAGAT